LSWFGNWNSRTRFAREIQFPHEQFDFVAARFPDRAAEPWRAVLGYPACGKNADNIAMTFMWWR